MQPPTSDAGAQRSGPTDREGARKTQKYELVIGERTRETKNEGRERRNVSVDRVSLKGLFYALNGTGIDRRCESDNEGHHRRNQGDCPYSWT
jgi:hypothetical protein